MKTTTTKPRKPGTRKGLGYIDGYHEAMRYVDNAKECLVKAKKQGDFYNDPKYVRMAGNTLWNGVLEALEAKYNLKKGKGRPSIEKYQEQVGKENRTMLKVLNNAYDYCHLYMGYDGNLAVITSKTAMENAITLIEWATRRKS